MKNWKISKTNTSMKRKTTFKLKTRKTNNNKIPKLRTPTNPTTCANGCKPTTNNHPLWATCPSNKSSKTNKKTCLKFGLTTSKTSSKTKKSKPPKDSPSATTIG